MLFQLHAFFLVKYLTQSLQFPITAHTPVLLLFPLSDPYDSGMSLKKLCCSRPDIDALQVNLQLTHTNAALDIYSVFLRT